MKLLSITNKKIVDSIGFSNCQIKKHTRVSLHLTWWCFNTSMLIVYVMIGPTQQFLLHNHFWLTLTSILIAQSREWTTAVRIFVGSKNAIEWQTKHLNAVNNNRKCRRGKGSNRIMHYPWGGRKKKTNCPSHNLKPLTTGASAHKKFVFLGTRAHRFKTA